MPVYEYRCEQCKKVFEYSHRMSDPSKTTCEECGGALERLISRTAFQFKGGGWYKDLYSSAKPESGASSESSKPAETAKPAETKTESKTETKSSESSGSGTGTGTGSAGGTSTKAAAGES